MKRPECFATETFSRLGFANWLEAQTDAYAASQSPEKLWDAYVVWYASTTRQDFTVAEMVNAMGGTQ